MRQQQRAAAVGGLLLLVSYLGASTHGAEANTPQTYKDASYQPIEDRLKELMRSGAITFNGHRGDVGIYNSPHGFVLMSPYTSNGNVCTAQFHFLVNPNGMGGIKAGWRMNDQVTVKFRYVAGAAFGSALDISVSEDGRSVRLAALKEHALGIQRAGAWSNDPQPISQAVFQARDANAAQEFASLIQTVRDRCISDLPGTDFVQHRERRIEKERQAALRAEEARNRSGFVCGDALNPKQIYFNIFLDSNKYELTNGFVGEISLVDNDNIYFHKLRFSSGEYNGYILNRRSLTLTFLYDLSYLDDVERVQNTVLKHRTYTCQRGPTWNMRSGINF